MKKQKNKPEKKIDLTFNVLEMSETLRNNYSNKLDFYQSIHLAIGLQKNVILHKINESLHTNTADLLQRLIDISEILDNNNLRIKNELQNVVKKLEYIDNSININSSY